MAESPSPRLVIKLKAGHKRRYATPLTYEQVAKVIEYRVEKQWGWEPIGKELKIMPSRIRSQLQEANPAVARLLELAVPRKQKTEPAPTPPPPSLPLFPSSPLSSSLSSVVPESPPSAHGLLHAEEMELPPHLSGEEEDALPVKDGDAWDTLQPTDWEYHDGDSDYRM
jgi:hypothetical protein